ncbi:MAG: PAS domain S-box protein [Desulfuromonadales bacterium]|nr:PAS domain S-box protein [Desulfuromonadales bacterium]
MADFPDIILNLALLVSLTVVSRLIDRYWSRQTLAGRIGQGLLFGSAVIFGMLNPLLFAPGLIFDGRSVLLSLSALFFGPVTAAIVAGLAVLCRIWIGGVGMLTGLLVIGASVGIGLACRQRLQPEVRPPSLKDLFLLGLLVHAAMLLLMFTLPGDVGMTVVSRIGLPVILCYPLATILVGELLASQVVADLSATSLGASVRRFQGLVESTGTIAWDFDTTSQRFTYVSPQIESIFGIAPSAWQTLDDWAATIHPDDRAAAIDYCRLKTEKEENHVFDYRMQTPDGRVRWVVDDVVLHREGGRVVGMSGFLHDVTRLKEAIIAHRLSEKRLRLILDSTVEGIYGVNHEGVCEFVNAAACRLLGYTEDELLGSKVHALLGHTDATGKQVAAESCQVSEVLATGKPLHNDDGIIWQKSGDWLNVEYTTVPVSADGQIVGAVVTFLDITEKKKLLEQRILAGQLTALGELAVGVAHEINNPITGVINYAQLLLNRSAPNERETKILNNIIKEGNRIATIVRNLLNFSSKNQVTMQPVALSRVIEETLELFCQQLIRDGIFVDIDCPDTLPTVLGNTQKLEQVLINLISNSRHALNEKYPGADPSKILRISAEPVRKDDQDRLRLTVWDQGDGISKLHLSRVFNRFFTTKAAGQGTGLGLSVVHDILQEHQASIWIDSEEGHYTRVDIDFPVCDDGVRSGLGAMAAESREGAARGMVDR